MSIYQPLHPARLTSLLNNRPQPRNALTPAQIRSRIGAVWFTGITDSQGQLRSTICTIQLDNGFEVRGESVVLDPDNFNTELGEHYAYQDAFSKLWPLLALMECERKHQQQTRALSPVEEAIVAWGKEKGIYDKSTVAAQLEKTKGELKELVAALESGDLDAYIDEAGDVAVTLIMGLTMQGTSLTEALTRAHQKVSKRKGKMRDGVFVKQSDLDWEAQHPGVVSKVASGWYVRLDSDNVLGPQPTESAAWDLARTHLKKD